MKRREKMPRSEDINEVDDATVRRNLRSTSRSPASFSAIDVSLTPRKIVTRSLRSRRLASVEREIDTLSQTPTKAKNTLVAIEEIEEKKSATPVKTTVRTQRRSTSKSISEMPKEIDSLSTSRMLTRRSSASSEPVFSPTVRLTRTRVQIEKAKSLSPTEIAKPKKQNKLTKERIDEKDEDIFIKEEAMEEHSSVVQKVSIQKPTKNLIIALKRTNKRAPTENESYKSPTVADPVLSMQSRSSRSSSVFSVNSSPKSDRESRTVDDDENFIVDLTEETILDTTNIPEKNIKVSFSDSTPKYVKSPNKYPKTPINKIQSVIDNNSNSTVIGSPKKITSPTKTLTSHDAVNLIEELHVETSEVTQRDSISRIYSSTPIVSNREKPIQCLNSDDARDDQQITQSKSIEINENAAKNQSAKYLEPVADQVQSPIKIQATNNSQTDNLETGSGQKNQEKDSEQQEVFENNTPNGAENDELATCNQDSFQSVKRDLILSLENVHIDDDPGIQKSSGEDDNKTVLEKKASVIKALFDSDEEASRKSSEGKIHPNLSKERKSESLGNAYVKKADIESNEIPMIFSRSWNESVRGNSKDSPYIDPLELEVRKTKEEKHIKSNKKSKPSIPSDDEISEEGSVEKINEFIDDEAMECNEEDDSMDSSTQREYEENLISDVGESLGSVDTEDDGLDDSEGTDGSFVVSDESLETNNTRKDNRELASDSSGKRRQRIIMNDSSESDDDDDDMEVPSSTDEKNKNSFVIEKIVFENPLEGEVNSNMQHRIEFPNLQCNTSMILQNSNVPKLKSKGLSKSLNNQSENKSKILNISLQATVESRESNERKQDSDGSCNAVFSDPEEELSGTDNRLTLISRANESAKKWTHVNITETKNKTDTDASLLDINDAGDETNINISVHDEGQNSAIKNRKKSLQNKVQEELDSNNDVQEEEEGIKGLVSESQDITALHPKSWPPSSSSEEEDTTILHGSFFLENKHIDASEKQHEETSSLSDEGADNHLNQSNFNPDKSSSEDVESTVEDVIKENNDSVEHAKLKINGSPKEKLTTENVTTEKHQSNVKEIPKSFNFDRILNRCHDISQSLDEAKKLLKAKNQIKKDKPKRIKKKKAEKEMKAEISCSDDDDNVFTADGKQPIERKKEKHKATLETVKSTDENFSFPNMELNLKEKTVLTHSNYERTECKRQTEKIISKKRKMISCSDEENHLQTSATEDPTIKRSGSVAVIKQNAKKHKAMVFSSIKTASGEFSERSVTPKKKKLRILVHTKAGDFVEEPVTPHVKKNQKGFIEEPVTPPTLGFKVKQILFGCQPDMTKHAKQQRKIKRKRLIREPSSVLQKPVWTSSGVFLEEDLGAKSLKKYGTATEFTVTPLSAKKSMKKQKTLVDSSSSAHNFKNQAMFNNRIQRETSKQLLERIEKQKIYKRL